MSGFDREEQAEASIRDDMRRGVPAPDAGAFWSEVSRREHVLLTVPCGPDTDSCDFDYFCKAHRIALDGPDEAPRNNACVECGRPADEQCDTCDLPVCDWSVRACIQGPAESCGQQHIAGHVAEENEAYVAEMEGGTL